jgi:glycosyltransferase involved in cell wall biosynthesis
MRILLVSSSDYGGAGSACLRLFHALQELGDDVKMVVLDKQSSEEGVFAWTDVFTGLERKYNKLRTVVQGFQARRMNDRIVAGRTYRGDSFTVPWPALLGSSHPLLDWADVVHLHWCAQFWDWRSFRALPDKAFFWTMHDLNPATGGCHYPGDCTQYAQQCVRCPQLAGTANDRIVAAAFRNKARALHGRAGARIKIIAPSTWMSTQVRTSSLFRQIPLAVVGNAFDETVFHPMDQSFCRDVLGIPKDRKVVLFAANYLGNYRKGMDIILAALEELANAEAVMFCAAGNGTVAGKKFPVMYLGSIVDERLMAMVYNAADLFAIPSREDNLPNTVAEAHLCGTPVVGFDRGGVGEMIENDVDGILVRNVSASALASAILQALSKTWNEDRISTLARERFGRLRIAQMHKDLYSQSLSR